MKQSNGALAHPARLRRPGLIGFVLAAGMLGSLACQACGQRPSAPSPSQAVTPPPDATANPVPLVPASAASTESWTTLGPGLSVRPWSVGGPAPAHVVRLNPKQWELLSVGAAQGQDGGSLLRPAPELGALVQARVVINGGFFGSQGEVLGLRASRGKRWAKLRTADWGVFFVREARPGLVHTQKARELGPVEFAVQCGPRLIVDGNRLHLREAEARRTVIGSDRAGQIVLLATPEAIGLNELSDLLARPETSGGLGLTHALNLDGGPSTQIHITETDGRWDIRGSGVADAIAVVPRK